MEIKKYSYENNGSKIAATVLIVLNAVCAIAAAVMTTWSYSQFWLLLLLTAIILLAVVSLVLSLVSIFASPKLLTVASIFVALTQLAATSMCLYVMSQGSLFNSLDTWITAVIFVAVFSIFAACWVSFIVVRAQFVSNPNKKKGFRCAAIILTVIACLLVGAEITSGITGQNKLLDIKTYYSQTIDVETQMSDDGIDDSDQYLQYNWAKYDYANMTVTEYVAVYDANTYVCTAYTDDEAKNLGLTYFRQRGALKASETPQTVSNTLQWSIDINDISELNDKYLVVRNTSFANSEYKVIGNTAKSLPYHLQDSPSGI